MLVKEYIQAIRDVRMRFFIFAMPVIQLFIFGYALTLDVKHISFAVCDLDKTLTSRVLIDSFRASEHFVFAGMSASASKASKLLDSGSADLLIIIEQDFSSRLKSGKGANVQIIIDGTESYAASIILKYSAKIITDFNADYLKQLKSKTGMRMPGVKLATRAWFNENLESKPYFIPGLLALVISLITVILTSMAIVREKEIGTIEQIMVTPIKPWEFILGKTVPFALVGFIDSVLVLLVARFWFDAPMRGSLLVLYLGIMLYLFAMLGIGLFVSTVCTTQQQAMITAFFFFLPFILLSGFMFPVRNMPMSVQYVTVLNPMRHLMTILRYNFLKGAGLRTLFDEMLALLLIGIGIFTLTIMRFKKTLK